MRVTHLGHACLLIESSGTRILIDPGAYSTGFEDLRDLDAVLVTHFHGDHIDPERFPALVETNPNARLLIEPQTIETYDLSTATAISAGDTALMGDLEVRAVGGHHASNHDLIPPVGNVGFLLRSDQGPMLFHPGDCYDETPPGVDILALPLNAPWCRMRETLDFMRAVNPRVAVPIHDGLLNDDGRAAYLMHVERFGPADTDVVDLHLGQSYDA
ncbi:MAG: MBL fold metallo-hydrolase [Nocardioidaceae bacterium]